MSVMFTIGHVKVVINNTNNGCNMKQEMSQFYLLYKFLFRSFSRQMAPLSLMSLIHVILSWAVSAVRFFTNIFIYLFHWPIHHLSSHEFIKPSKSCLNQLGLASCVFGSSFSYLFVTSSFRATDTPHQQLRPRLCSCRVLASLVSLNATVPVVCTITCQSLNCYTSFTL